MSRHVKLWCICGMLALGLLLPGFAAAQDNPVQNIIKAEQGPAPEMSVAQEEAPITLEELKKMFGAHNVCGAPCGFGQPKCHISCGDAAACRNGYCIYL